MSELKLNFHFPEIAVNIVQYDNMASVTIILLILRAVLKKTFKGVN
jgi:hypothetical protein